MYLYQQRLMSAIKRDEISIEEIERREIKGYAFKERMREYWRS
jgi:hypothetical protein